MTTYAELLTMTVSHQSFTGLRVITDVNMVEKLERFPRSKRKRIRKKWAKRPWPTIPSRKFLYLAKENTLVVHPELHNKMKREIANRQERFSEKLFINSMFGGSCPIAGIRTDGV